ncbi:MAG: ankyrin repeat domain-containing protein [Clostridia bacterium]|nr:ankyrin repeat domain-containing protein [Clostridia bacterium]
MKKLLIILSILFSLVLSSCIIYAHFFTSAIDSARSGNTKRLQKQLENVKDASILKKAMYYAVSNNQPESLKVILDYAPTQMITRNILADSPPLFVASSFGFNEVVRVLVENGANVNKADGNKQTPLTHALNNSHYNTAIFLINIGANPNDFAYHPELKAYGKDNKPNKDLIDLINLMLTKGVDIKGKAGEEMLGAAIHAKNYALINTLIEKGGSLHLSSVVHRAVMYNDMPTVKFLVEKGVDFKSEKILIALYAALSKDKDQIFRYLLEKESELNRKKLGDLLFLFAFNKNIETAKLLIEKGADIHDSKALFAAIRNCNSEMVKLLLEKGASISVKDHNNLDVFELLKATRKRVDWFDFKHKNECDKIYDLLNKARKVKMK